MRLLKSAFSDKLREAELSALAVSLLGVSALLLACLGIVGLVAYSVSQRTKEIGIRMALGATRVARPVGRAAPALAAGRLSGCWWALQAAAALSQLLRRELYGVSNLDPIAYLAAIAIFVVTAALTALVPARRALRVDPLQALRYE